ncbi:helix-turn-helix domain-containing protein [Sporosarcina sp. PTS2304]|uniref:substrate-binding domain-containing protein n=1 Tax=Sporosarcina sp. PTS2304 TaxID=2283194 RepID=UPI000E0DC4CD|nr:substrate-binding domain-containing protein [Sporosarcina sp. PTS2304]AXH99187.1 helix-turn-helix domain-containing protein [Sporosarcina sp. PTS2304]
MSNSEQNISYTTEEIAQLLKVSKLTIYDLIKKGEIRAYRVGRQMRVDAVDLTSYKEQLKSGGNLSDTRRIVESSAEKPQTRPQSDSVIISGQDISLDILASYIDEAGAYRPLRSFTGSLNSLIKMYHGEADIVSTHLFDGETGTYNLPYIQRLLTGHSYIVIHLLVRKAGIYVQKGNPQQIHDWADLAQPGLRLINREKGSGARVLLDEQLRLASIAPSTIMGYEDEEQNHMAVAARIASKQADVGVGIEKTARLIDVDFIPLIDEQYDLVLLKTKENEQIRDFIVKTINDPDFQAKINAIGGYDLTNAGDIRYETP